MAESQKERIMRVLEVNEKEANEILAYDNAVDKGLKTQYDFTKEQEKETRKYRQADRKPISECALSLFGSLTPEPAVVSPSH